MGHFLLKLTYPILQETIKMDIEEEFLEDPNDYSIQEVDPLSIDDLTAINNV